MSAWISSSERISTAGMPLRPEIHGTVVVRLSVMPALLAEQRVDLAAPLHQLVELDLVWPRSIGDFTVILMRLPST
jgi:hypothetical protein